MLLLDINVEAVVVVVVIVLVVIEPIFGEVSDRLLPESIVTKWLFVGKVVEVGRIDECCCGEVKIEREEGK